MGSSHSTAAPPCDPYETDADRLATELDISEQEIYEYLARVALGSEKVNDVATTPLAERDRA